MKELKCKVDVREAIMHMYTLIVKAGSLGVHAPI